LLLFHHSCTVARILPLSRESSRPNLTPGLARLSQLADQTQADSDDLDQVEAATLRALRKLLRDYRELQRAVSGRETPAAVVMVVEDGYSRRVRKQAVRWVCMRCGTPFEEMRVPGTFLPRYCEGCRDLIRKARDRLRKRWQAAEQREMEQAEAEQREPDFGRVVYGMSPEEEELRLRPARYCHNCGHDFSTDGKGMGTADDVLKRECPACHHQIVKDEQAYREATAEAAATHRQWRMPRRAGVRPEAEPKLPGHMATLNSARIREEKRRGRGAGE
jgi:DNA-directed RNA polymerase subunit RPC12/RpoP